MTIEENIFKRSIVDFSKLPAYGFVKSADTYVYTQTFMHGDFKAMINIDKQGNISGEVYETDSDDIYFPLRVESMAAGFVGEVRAEYEKILHEIKEHCCQNRYFISPQSNRLTQKIFSRFADEPTFPWDTFDGYGVFKNPQNNKWYALVMNIDRSKLDKQLSGEVEVVNLKVKPDKMADLLTQKGFYPAYHMNKKNWITIVLDDRVADKLLFALLQESHNFTLIHSRRNNEENVAWLVPANPKYFMWEHRFRLFYINAR